MKIGDKEIQVLGDEEFEKYLGRKLCMGSYHERELQNRISAGWAAFTKYKNEFCSKFYQLKDKIKLFESVVTLVVLYGEIGSQHFYHLPMSVDPTHMPLAWLALQCEPGSRSESESSQKDLP